MCEFLNHWTMTLLLYRWLLLFCTSLFVLKDCQSFFLRHTVSTQCITTGKLVYDDKDWALPYFTVMTDNCLDPKAQFRFLDKELVQHISTGGNFHSTDDGRYNNSLAVYKAVASDAQAHQNSTKQRVKQTDAGSLYFYDAVGKNKVCLEPAGTFVERKTYCNKTEQKFTFGSVTDYNTKMKDVHCSPKQLMVVQRADYGDFNNSGVFDGNATIDKTCSTMITCRMKNRCNGKISCGQTIDSDLLLPKYCSDTSKEIYTEYICLDNYSSPVSGKVPNMRLSKSPIEGFIEIKNGSIWKKVKEEYWNENSQKILCQFLGFHSTDKNDIATQELGSGQDIAEGILLNDAQPTAIPICIHLEPFTTSSKVDMPYATCKICDRLLQLHVTGLPDSAFSGSGGADYKEAKFLNNGWCPTSGRKYLAIDLQKEYHITRVAILGDKDQTKWSESFTLKYSYDKTLVDNSNQEQITGNQNGYQASFTQVDIYNARYVKIEPTGNKDFCLRVEFCGEVQSLEPVTDVIAKPSNFSVHLSWTIPGPKTSRYITHFIIYLNGTEQLNISRETYGNEFDLTGLKPYTGYIVGIVALDSYFRRSNKIPKEFKTTEAVPNGPPVNVNFSSRGKTFLEVDWQAPPKRFWNGVLTGYQVCFSTNDSTAKCFNNNSHSYTIHELQPSTKYFVTVAAGTSVGYGNKSSEISKITNGEPVNPVSTSYYTLGLNIPRPEEYIKAVMVIVRNAINNLASSEDIETNQLEPYQANTTDLYISAYLKADVLPLTFVIGDGKEYNSEIEKYLNQPLKQNTSYIVFLRFLEGKDSYYSTEWSTSVKTMVKPAAEYVDSKDSDLSSDEKTRIRFIVPLVILAIGFLLLLGVFISCYTYQRRLLQNFSKQPSSKPPTTNENSDDDYESTECVKDAQESMYVNDESPYENVDNVLGSDEPTGQEPSPYMSLKENREPPNAYEALQVELLDRRVVRHHAKKGDQATLHQNPAFNSNSIND